MNFDSWVFTASSQALLSLSPLYSISFLVLPISPNLAVGKG